MKQKRCFLLFSSLLLFVFSGCANNPTAIPAPVYTAPLPTRIVATKVIIQNEPDCIDNFYYVDDVNYPDGTYVEPGQKFLKEWEVINNGSCNWIDGYLLRFVSGEQMGAPESVPIPHVEVGKKGKFSVEFTAPKEPGTYRSIWKPFNDRNRSFGETVYLEIVVYGYPAE